MFARASYRANSSPWRCNSVTQALCFARPSRRAVPFNAVSTRAPAATAAAVPATTDAPAIPPILSLEDPRDANTHGLLSPQERNTSRCDGHGWAVCDVGVHPSHCHV